MTRALLVAGAAGALATVVVFAVMFAADDPGGFAWSVPFLGTYVAGVIAWRLRPEHVGARRMLMCGTAATLFISAAVGISLAFDDGGRGWWLGPANVAVQWLGLAQGAAVIALLAVYPDGAYDRAWERRLVRVAAGLAVAVPVALLVARPTVQPAWVFAWGDESTVAEFPQIDSPVHVGALGFLGGPLRLYLDAALALAPLVGAAVATLRYRRLDAARRLQMRWPVYGVLTVLVAPAAALLQESGVLTAAVAQPLVIAGLIALPASVLVGLVKPDLFDVDGLMLRSRVYGPVWIAIGGAYVGIAAAVGLAASSVGLQLAIALTIVVTVLFEPARRNAAGRAARWAYGESVGGEELVRRLGTTLAHTHDPEQLTRAIAANAREGLGADWVRICVEGAEPVVDGAVVGLDVRAALSAGLVHAGKRLGEIECGPRIRGRAHGSDRELLDTLAPQAALAINNARLASELGLKLEELEAQAAELAASRARIVAAQESARRQIERDIHDGAQQELVALIARIGLARRQFARDPGRLGETLGDLQSEARQALENLRQLASGIHPSVLSDHGLVEAIEIRSSRLPLGVTIECDPQMRAMRFTDEIESAAYFFVSEGLANTLKHAGAERAVVHLVRSGGDLQVVVSDDGVGFAVDGVGLTGLRGLGDRIEAVGGAVAIDSWPGRGTRLTARLPIGDRVVV